MTHSDFAIGTITTANTEFKVGTINIPGGARIKQIGLANRLGVGTTYLVRLDYAGIKTPQKYTPQGILYDSIGTEVQPMACFASAMIDCDIPLPSNVNSVDVYATADTNSTKVAISLVWA